jgi:hypothetical protein
MDAVIDPVEVKVVGVTPVNSILVGPWASFITLPVPEGADQETLGVESDGQGGFTFVEDPLKVQAKLDAAWTSLRTERNARLAATDWVALADAHLSQDKKDAWFAYRQALRDLPDEVTDPMNVDWPLDPTQAPVVPVTGSRLSSLLTHAEVEPAPPVVEEEVTEAEPVPEATDV